MEIEAKFTVPNTRTWTRLQAAKRLVGFSLSESRIQQVRDTYLDTAERSILAAGYACRQREMGEGVLITLKGLGGARGAIHRREEMEIMLPTPKPPVQWPASAVRDQVLQLIGKIPLEPLFQMEQTRHTRLVSRGSRLVAVWSLDEVHLRASGAERVEFELEVELAKDGGEDDLAAITAFLEKEWGLRPQPWSKFERAWAFLETMGVGDDLLAPHERVICQHLATRGDAYARRAAALLALSEGARQSEAGRRAGISARMARYWLAAFREKRLGIFPPQVLVGTTPLSLPPKGQAEHPTAPGASGGAGNEGVWPLELLFDRYWVDRAHARAVADRALELFDRLADLHGLPPERRPLLEIAALLHNIGLETDVERHHIVGREILLMHPPLELDEQQRRIAALTTFLHRKRITRKKLELLARDALFADLPAAIQADTLTLAALVRMADGLDYSQSGSSRLGRVRRAERTVEIGVVGPYAEVDAGQAQAKSDLWRLICDVELQFRAAQDSAGEDEPSPDVHLVAEPRTEAEKPASPGLQPDDSMAEAGRKTLYFHFQEMIRHEPGVLLGEDVEELHDMRVATRRCRAAFRVFGDYLDMERMRPFLKELQRAGRILGDVRDMDVFWEKAQRYLDALPAGRSGELAALRAVWQAERDRKRETMLLYLASERYIQFKERFGEFLQTPGASAPPVLAADGEPISHRLRHVAPVAVYQRIADMRALGESLRGAETPLARYHQLRIAAKRARYTLEFFQEVLGPEVERLIGILKRLQDHLGDLQDGSVACNLLRDFLIWGDWGHARAEGKSLSLPAEPVIAPDVATYLAARQAEVQRLLETFPATWAQVESGEFDRLTAASLAQLTHPPAGGETCGRVNI